MSDESSHETPPVKILNVDDAEVARYTKTRILRHAGFDVVEAANGQGALDIVAAQRPALVLLDVRLPDTSGIEVCKVIKARWPSTMVLQTSATYVTSSDRVRGLDGGADSYLSQPIDPDELVAAIRALMRLHAAEESVRSLNESLEQRIAARTDDLRSANALLTEQMAQRERAEAALVQSQKLEAVGQLTGVMAHDFNNVLAAVQGYLHLIRRRSGQGELKDLAEKALGVVRRGAKLTSRVLSFAHGKPLRNEAVDASALLLGMQDWLNQSTGKSVQLHLRTEAAELVAVTDANQLELAVLNLVINSRDAMPQGGRIDIAAERRVIEGDTPDLGPGDYVVVSVSDNGPGMTAEVAARVFEPFYTTKPAGRGTGLGLAQVQQLARQSNGSARLSTKEGQGTRFELWLPAGSRDMLAPVSEPSTAPPTASTRILVVDDDLDVRVTVAAFLIAQGFLVETASDGPEAVQMLRTARPDGLILDVAMPGMTGMEVARVARGMHPTLPVLFISGNADVAGIEGEVVGAALVRKPFDPANLLAALAACMMQAGPAGLQEGTAI